MSSAVESSVSIPRRLWGRPGLVGCKLAGWLDGGERHWPWDWGQWLLWATAWFCLVSCEGTCFVKEAPWPPGKKSYDFSMHSDDLNQEPTGRIQRAAKHILVTSGAWVPSPTLRRLQYSLTYMKLGRWMVEHGVRFKCRVRDREAVFAAVADQVRDRRVLYLAFGVCQGASMRDWSQMLKDRGSTLHGFDSFEGLPEDWDGLPKGTFSTQGTFPLIHDNQVRLFKGWFDQVLPTCSPPEHDVLIVVMDADLYSSTIYGLQYLRPWIQPATFLYFDDMSYPEDEPRAFHEFMAESGLRSHPVCADKSLRRTFFEGTG
jgi:hypothetical protein